MDRSLIDLRSDTVTRPTAAMRQAIAKAEVGDDVIGVDPTVQRLQQRIAEMLGKEAAIFMPSGTMTNQVAIRVHCQPGDELICEVDSHIYNYEQGAFAQFSGVVAHTIKGNAGILRAEQLESCIRPDNEHMVRTRLLCLENTHNRGGGSIQPIDVIQELCRWARENRLRSHLDGARLFNAVVASGIPAADWAAPFDTISVCFSKGLGAPVGSALVGPADLIDRARRHRKVFGGGMRQVGVIAAGALYALEHHVDRMAEDHTNARMLAAAVEPIAGLTLAQKSVETNIVYFEVDPEVGTAAEVLAILKGRGVLMLAETPTRIRAVTHLDVDADEIQQAGHILREVIDALS
jgi:threonine aldolase